MKIHDEATTIELSPVEVQKMVRDYLNANVPGMALGESFIPIQIEGPGLNPRMYIEVPRGSCALTK